MRDSSNDAAEKRRTNMMKDGFWNGPTWLRDDSKRTTRKFATAEAARAAAQRAYEKAKKNGEQTVDRFYLLGGGETNALFLD
jgi:cytosine/adenosine deaminase-related metal-dependent hydrolase